MNLEGSLNEIFKYSLGCKVRDKHNQDGYISMLGFDYRGILYRINFSNGHTKWLSEFEIKKIEFNSESDNNFELKSDRPIKTDINEKEIFFLNEKTAKFKEPE